MTALTKFYQFSEDVAEGVHTFSTDQFTVALCNAANPPLVTNTLLANLTQIAYTNLSTRNLALTSTGQTTGTFQHLFADLVLTASGGSVAPFRYIAIYNSGTAALVDPLVGFYDYGSDVTLLADETMTIDFTTSSIEIA